MTSGITLDYPWLGPAWRRLTEYVDSGRLPPALMLTGIRGLGKTLLARAFAQRLLCRTPEQHGACGGCSSCRLVTAGTHPDLLVLEPEEPGKPIKVDGVRDIINRLSLKPHFGGSRVVLIVSADAMNRYAANSVLKTLEEPDASTVFLLVTSGPEYLPATVRSRCQAISIAPPERDELLAWLQDRTEAGCVEELCEIAQGAPLRAVQLSSSNVVTRRQEIHSTWRAVADGSLDPVSAAATWEKSAEDAITWLMRWVEELARQRCILMSEESASGVDRRECVPGRREALVALFRYRDLLITAKRGLASQVNRQLMMEELAIQWFRIGESRVHND